MRQLSVAFVIDTEDTTPETVAELVQEKLKSVLDEIPGNIAPTLFQHTLTPIHTITENSGSDSMGEYDYRNRHSALLLTVVAMWVE